MHLPEYFLGDVVSTVAFGIIAIVLVVVGYRVFDRLTPGVAFDEEVKKGNIAVAIVIGSFIVAICYLISRVVSAVLGG